MKREQRVMVTVTLRIKTVTAELGRAWFSVKEALSRAGRKKP